MPKAIQPQNQPLKGIPSPLLHEKKPSSKDWLCTGERSFPKKTIPPTQRLPELYFLVNIHVHLHPS